MTTTVVTTATQVRQNMGAIYALCPEKKKKANLQYSTQSLEFVKFYLHQNATGLSRREIEGEVQPSDTELVFSLTVICI